MRYLQINQSSFVENVIVLDDETYASFSEDEKQFFIKDPAIANPDINLATIGMMYIQEHNRFAYPKVFASWIFSVDTNDWVPPIPFPEEVGHYEWDEETTSWKSIPDTE